MATTYTSCPHCGARIAPGKIRCNACGKLSTAPVDAAELLPPDQALQREIQRQIAAGWLLTSQTVNSATFTRKGEANPLIAILLLLLAILPGVLYIMLARPTLTLYIVVGPDGTVTRTEGKQ